MGFPELMTACNYGRLETVEQLLNNGVSPKARKSGYVFNERETWTGPLHASVHHCADEGREKRHRKIIKLLIQHGADVNLHDGFNTPLQVAVMRGAYKVVKILVSNGAKADEECIKLAGHNSKLLQLLNSDTIPERFIENPYLWVKFPDELPLFGNEKYRYLEPLGEGGYGVIFLARRVSDGKEVAVKFLLCDQDREDEMLSRIQNRGGHPNIVTFYQAYKVWGKTWIHMEYIPGQKLSMVWDSLSNEEQQKIRAEIASARQFMSDAGVHTERENDKENVLITYVNGLATAKLIDFGTLAQR